MKRLYNRMVFQADDNAIASPEVEDEVVEPVEDNILEDATNDLDADMADLFEDIIAKPDKDPEVEPEIEPEIDPAIELDPVVEPVIKPEVESPLSELDELRASNAKLLEQINALSQTPTAPAARVEEGSTGESESKISGVNLAEVFKDTDVSDLFETKEGFLGFMQQVADHVQARTLEQFQQVAPQLVSQSVQVQNSMAEIRDAFYSDNSDLKPVAQYVSRVATSVSEKNPTWTVDQVLTQAAVDTRAALNIKVVNKDVKKEVVKPALPGALSRGKGKPAPTNSLADEMEDLFSDI